MKTLQEQYNLIQEGKGHKDVFMKSARRLFPEYVTNFATYQEATKILKQKSILSEAAGGVVTQKSANPFVNWSKFLAEESNKSKGDKEIEALEKEASKYSKNDVRYKELQKKIGDLKSDKEYAQPGSKAAKKFSKPLNEEAKAEEKKPTKEVVDTETKGYDYKDPKNTDNLNFEEMLRGYYAEMKDPKNADKTEEQLREMVAKNLAKDPSFYVKDGAFGIKGIGYTDDIPGLKVSDKELKGEYASSGMEKVKIKENMVKLTDLLNEAIGGYTDLRPIGMTNENTTTDSEEDGHVGANTDDDFEREQRAQLAARNENARTDAEEEGYLDGMRDEKADEKAKAKAKNKKGKKESVDSKLAEIEKAGRITTLEAQIEALSELIEGKTQRLSLVSEDESLSELMDKKKIKDMQREIKDLEKRKMKMEKLYEKMCGKSYSKPEIVDEAADEYED